MNRTHQNGRTGVLIGAAAALTLPRAAIRRQRRVSPEVKPQSHGGNRALTALAFFGMRSRMEKLFVICLILGVFGLWTKADEKGQTEKSKLIHIAADVGEIVRGSSELCEEEFPALDAKFKGDKYNDLIARLRTPMETAKGLPEYLQKVFPGFFQNDRCEYVDNAVLQAVDQLRALDGVLLAEALAGSGQSEKLILSLRPHVTYQR